MPIQNFDEALGIIAWDQYDLIGSLIGWIRGQNVLTLNQTFYFSMYGVPCYTTLLHQATVRVGFAQVFCTLVLCGADLNARDSCNATPLHLSIAFSRRYIQEYLLRSPGTDVNAIYQDEAGQYCTPIQLAELKQKLEAAEVMSCYNDSNQCIVGSFYKLPLEAKPVDTRVAPTYLDEEQGVENSPAAYLPSKFFERPGLKHQLVVGCESCRDQAEYRAQFAR